MILQIKQLNIKSVKHLIYQIHCFLFKVFTTDRLYDEHIHPCKDNHQYINRNKSDHRNLSPNTYLTEVFK